MTLELPSSEGLLLLLILWVDSKGGPRSQYLFGVGRVLSLQCG